MSHGKYRLPMSETIGRPRQLLRKQERRAQLIDAAARAFVRGGFTATSLEDVAAEAGVTKVVIYHHFDSKRELYLAVLRDAGDRVQARIAGAENVGAENDGAENDGAENDGAEEDAAGTLHQFALAAQDNPDGFRLLYRHARREPEFASEVVDIWATGAATAEAALRAHIPEAGQRAWVAALTTTVVVDAALTWLDAGQPVSAEQLADTMHALTGALLTANG